MTKRKTIKIIKICFWGYMVISLLFTLKKVFLTPESIQNVKQYSEAEIVIYCCISIIDRSGFK